MVEAHDSIVGVEPCAEGKLSPRMLPPQAKGEVVLLPCVGGWQLLLSWRMLL